MNSNGFETNGAEASVAEKQWKSNAAKEVYGTEELRIGKEVCGTAKDRIGCERMRAERQRIGRDQKRPDKTGAEMERKRIGTTGAHRSELRWNGEQTRGQEWHGTATDRNSNVLSSIGKERKGSEPGRKESRRNRVEKPGDEVKRTATE